MRLSVIMRMASVYIIVRIHMAATSVHVSKASDYHQMDTTV